MTPNTKVRMLTVDGNPTRWVGVVRRVRPDGTLDVRGPDNETRTLRVERVREV